MKTTNLQLLTAQRKNLRYLNIITTITRYQMTRYAVTVSDFLWIAAYCVTGTFSTLIIRVSYAYFILFFLKNTYVF